MYILSNKILLVYPVGHPPTAAQESLISVGQTLRFAQGDSFEIIAKFQTV